VVMRHRISLEGDWRKAQRILNSFRGGRRLNRAVDRAVLQEAQEFRRDVVQGIRQQAPGGRRFRPLSRLTIALRKAKRGSSSSKALIDTGNMRNSIRIIRSSGAVFVGISRNARTRDGKSMVSIALVHENGATIRITVTRKMQQFFFAMLAKAGMPPGPSGAGGSRVGSRVSVVGVSRGGFSVGAVLVIRIPARPFFAPVVQQKFGNPAAVRTRVLRRVALNLAGDLGFV